MGTKLLSPSTAHAASRSGAAWVRAKKVGSQSRAAWADWLGLDLRHAWPLSVLAMIAGCVWVQFVSQIQTLQTIAPFLPAACLFSAAVLALLAQQYGQATSVARSSVCLALAALAGAVLGVVWAASIGVQRVADGWPAAQEGVDITATGYVASMPTLGTASQRVTFVIESNDAITELNGKTLLLSWYYGSLNLQPAQRYQLTFRAKQRHGGLNPDGFDYELWLVSRGIAATAYIRDAKTPPQDLGTQVLSFLPWVERVRAHIRTRLFATAPTPEAARWAAALALGDQRSLSDADWQRYNATGTGHLLAVSGTHITLMGALLAWLAGHWWQLRAQRLLRLPVQTLRLNVMLISSAAYALIAGWALPAQRTVLMLVVAWWALRWMACPAVWHVMASSAFVALILDPMAVIAPSFWLSYGAVAVLIGIEIKSRGTAAHPDPTLESDNVANTLASKATDASRWQGYWASFKVASRSQLLLSAALLPLGAVFFNQISWVSPLANAVAIPLMGWLSTPLALLSALLALVWGSMAAALMQALLAAQQLMDGVLDALLAVPHAQLFVPSAPTAWVVFGMLCAVGCVILHRAWRWAAVCGVMMYVVGAFVWADRNNKSLNSHTRASKAVTSAPHAAWRAVFLDVGQGMAVAVHSQGRTLLFDVGPRYSADSDGAARVIVPYLRAAGVRQLDHVVLSHADDDHTGGTRSLLARLPVGQWWHSLAPANPLLTVLPHSSRRCEADTTVQWAGLTLQWLHPQAGVNHDAHKTNALSCVLRVSDGVHTVLLTGDIETAQEAALVTQYGAGLQAQVLLAPHHGSKTSSSEAFLNAVNPQHVLMQNGYRNRFGHPHPSVSQRYADRGLIQWRSDLDGAVLVHVTATSLTVAAWREQAQRYWHTVLPAASSLRAAVDGREF